MFCILFKLYLCILLNVIYISFVKCVIFPDICVPPPQIVFFVILFPPHIISGIFLIVIFPYLIIHWVPEIFLFNVLVYFFPPPNIYVPFTGCYFVSVFRSRFFLLIYFNLFYLKLSSSCLSHTDLFLSRLFAKRH